MMGYAGPNGMKGRSYEGDFGPGSDNGGSLIENKGRWEDSRWAQAEMDSRDIVYGNGYDTDIAFYPEVDQWDDPIAIQGYLNFTSRPTRDRAD